MVVFPAAPSPCRLLAPAVTQGRALPSRARRVCTPIAEGDQERAGSLAREKSVRQPKIAPGELDVSRLA